MEDLPINVQINDSIIRNDMKEDLLESNFLNK